MAMGWKPSVAKEMAGTFGKTDSDKILEREVSLAKAIGDVLFAHYPGYLWAVKVDLHGKTKAAMVQLPILMPARMHYTIPARFLTSENEMMRIVRNAGGEILERYKIPRTGIRFGQSAFLQARGHGADLNRLKRDVPV